MATGGVRVMGFRWVRRDALPGLVRPCRDLSGLFGTCWGLSGNAQRLFMQAEVHALDLRVQLQAIDAFFPSDAAAFAPPERGARDRLLVGVDPDRACLQRPADTPGFLEVFRPDATGQPACRAIGLVDQIG